MDTLRLLSLLAAATLGTACTTLDTDSDQLQERGGGEDDEECGCKIEGSDIGQIGAFVYVGDELIAFESWTEKEDSPGEYVGFVLSANAGSVSYVVKTGTETYPATGVTWSHPGGNSGPGAHGISNVDFCEDDADYDEDGDGGEGGEDLPDID